MKEQKGDGFIQNMKQLIFIVILKALTILNLFSVMLIANSLGNTFVQFTANKANRILKYATTAVPVK